MFKIGDKVVTVSYPNGVVYEITHITRDGYYVCENETTTPSIFGSRVLLPYHPTFSYYHPQWGLHEWYVESSYNLLNCVIRSSSNDKVTAIVPIDLVEHYLGELS